MRVGVLLGLYAQIGRHGREPIERVLQVLHDFGGQEIWCRQARHVLQALVA